jgi:hypothetical protein
MILPFRSTEESRRFRRLAVDRCMASGVEQSSGVPGQATVCQVCGCLWEIRGFSHLFAARTHCGERFCLRCVPREDASDVLRENAHRYCEVCLGRVPARGDQRVQGHWVCCACRSEVAHLDAPDVVLALLNAANQIHEETFPGNPHLTRLHGG